MNTPKLLAAAAAMLMVAGCTSAPEVAPAPPPQPSYVPYAPEAIPSAKQSGEWEWTPGPLRSGPTPGTVLGPTGKVLRVIPADPTRSFKCRTATDKELYQLAVGFGEDYDRTKRVRAVDLAEGWSIVGFWDSTLLDGPETGALLSGPRLTFLGYGAGGWWHGSHTNAGIAFEDGPKALRAALECVS